MKTIDSTEIHLSPALVTALEDGETLVLTQQSAHLAVIVPLAPAASARPFGLAKGQFTVPAGFNDPLPDLEGEIYDNQVAD